MKIELRVNGSDYTIVAESNLNLRDALKEIRLPERQIRWLSVGRMRSLHSTVRWHACKFLYVVGCPG